MKALKVPKEEAEDAKRMLLERELMDFGRVPETTEDHVYFPIRESFGSEHEIVERDLPEKEERPTFEELLVEKLTEGELEEVKTAQDIIGDIAILEIEEDLAHKEKEIGEALLEAKPYLKAVFRKGKHQGEYRTQELRLLAGEDEKETVHTENGVKLKLNVETVYFSPRLSTDRERIAEKVGKGERVLVMFSGCGPYPLVIAKNTQAEEIVGVEINPEAHRYGLENVKLNKAKNVKLIEGDAGEEVPKLEGRFDRIVMPAPDNASEYLDVAINKAKPGATIHYYDFLPEETYEEDALEVVAAACAEMDREYDITSVEKAGQVGPGRFRTCTEFKINNRVVESER